MDLDALKQKADAGEHLHFIAFWGHSQKREGVIDKSCFSQWYPAPFVVDGDRFATAEHFMMFKKATLFSDSDVAARILAEADPARVKRLGREVRGFEAATWERHRFDVVVSGNLAKFSQHPPLRDFLLGTGEVVIVEASPTDRIWGIGLDQHDEAAKDPRRWRGLNLLGFALMKVRDALRHHGAR